MAEEHNPEPRQSRTSPAAMLLLTVLAVAALVAALLVVVRSLHRVQPGDVPASLRPETPDTGFTIFRARMRRQANGLATHCRLKRRQLGNNITPAQDSLGRECDSASTEILRQIAAFDTVRPAGRKKAADSITAMYDRARLKLRAFIHSGLPGDTISEDSLDKELRGLISQ